MLCFCEAWVTAGFTPLAPEGAFGTVPCAAPQVMYGAVLRLLTGPVESLNTFMKGMDAAELMQLSAPEPGYQIV